MERIVTQERCGLVFKAGDPENLAEVVAQLRLDDVARCSMGVNGWQAVQQRFHWERDAVELRRAVARFA